MEKLEITPIVNMLRKFEGATPVIDLPESGVSVDHSFCMATIIGAALAYHLPLPNEKVNNLTVYFNQSFLTLLQETLSAINEQYPIRVMIALDACKNTYKLRYDQVYNPIENIEDILNRIVLGDNNNLTTNTGVSLAVQYPQEYGNLLRAINLGCLSLNNYQGLIV